MKVGYVKGGLGLASALLLAVAIGNAGAADKWFVLGEKVLTSMSGATVIKAEEGKMWKDDVKKAKLSVDGADVEITNVVFHWRGGKDDTITNVGVLKAGAQTAEKDAPGRESTLTSVDVQYRILNNKPTATLKVWGFD